MKICKYELTARRVMLELPKGADILSVQIQNGILVLWALIEPKRLLKELRHFIVVATGEEFDADGAQYIATVHMYEGREIYHVFEVGY